MRKFKFLVPSIITFMILCILFYMKGLYPFTDNSIVQVDADYQFIPVLYRIYDFLHGNGNIIYDDIGLGNNIYISMIIQGSIFSPLSLLLYFTDRSNIVNYFNIIVMIKFSLLSLTTYIFINKTFKINEYYKIIFSVLYAFSGWMVLNYFNIMWLDSVILFPLIVMYLNKLIEEGKWVGYIITLSLSLIISYYISYFILLFILFYSFMYIILKLDKERAKKVIFSLGIGTLISILISSFSLLPSLYQTLISSRLDSSHTSNLISNFMNKSLYLILSSVFLVLFACLIVKYKKDRKNIFFYLILLFLFGIGLFIEPINLAIHLGSYWSFPYRYSFVTLFILMCGSLYFLSKHDFNCVSKYENFKIILFTVFGIILLFLNRLFYNTIIDSQIILDFDSVNAYWRILIIFTIIVVMILISLNLKNKMMKYVSFGLICLIQIFVYSGWTMYYWEGYHYSKDSNKINNNLNIIDSDLERYKVGYKTYTYDYAFIYGVNTLDNWLHILPNNQIEAYTKLGYRNDGTIVNSKGGTIFSDWLFNVGYLIDDELIDNQMYELKDNYDRYYLYKYNYNNAFGIVYDKKDKIEDNTYLAGFGLQNNIYRELFNKDSDIIKVNYYDYVDIVDRINIKYNIEEKGFVYIILFTEVDYIKVNGKNIIHDPIAYIIDFGMYNDDIELELGMKDDIDFSQFCLGFIKYDDIMNLSSNVNDVNKVNNGYDINVYNDKDNGYLFLPINNISGLNAYVNGEKINIDSYLNNFVSIKLDKGDNKIEIRYEMPLFKLGIILSVLGVICLILFKRIPTNKIMLNITYYMYIVVCLLFYLYIYGYSMIKYYS